MSLLLSSYLKTKCFGRWVLFGSYFFIVIFIILIIEEASQDISNVKRNHWIQLCNLRDRELYEVIIRSIEQESAEKIKLIRINFVSLKVT